MPPKRSTSGSKAKSVPPKDLSDFQALMAKGLELQKVEDDGSSSVYVIYTSLDFSTLYGAKKKNAPNAVTMDVRGITAVETGASDQRFTITHKSKKVRCARLFRLPPLPRKNRTAHPPSPSSA